MAELEDEGRSIKAWFEATRAEHRRLAGRLGDIAAEVAESEDRVAEQFEDRAGHAPERAAQLRAQAQHAREFAHEERRESERCYRVRDGID